MASQYSLTPEQFFSYTPRQLQKCLKHLHIRLHNDFVTKMRLAGHKGDYISGNVEKLQNEAIAQDIDMDALERSTNDYLAQVRAKHA